MEETVGEHVPRCNDQCDGTGHWLGMTRDEIIARLAEAFPPGPHRPPDMASQPCMVVFRDTDGENSIRPLTFGEIADALAPMDAPRPAEPID